MTHVRRQIRDGVMAALAGLPHTGANVFHARQHSLGERQLPALQLAVMGEKITRAAQGAPPVASRAAALVVQAEAVAGDGRALQDLLDAIGTEVERAVFAWAEAQPWILDHQLSETDLLFGDPSERRSGQLAMTWTITVLAREGDPDSIL